MEYLGQALVLLFLALAAPAFADSTVTYTYDANPLLNPLSFS